jgi:leader peptidase (prepilin peptidase) / N-methyltransferase
MTDAAGTARRRGDPALRCALGKTLGRTAGFVGAALALRVEGRRYTPLVCLLIGGAIWLGIGVVGAPGGLVIAISALAFLALLAAVCAIDARFGIIPDSLVIALAVAGVLQVAATGAADPIERVAEAGAVLAAAWLFRAGYFRVRGVQGLGLGDVKLMAAGVLWTGAASVPVVILVAVLSALVGLAVVRAQGHRLRGRDAIAFGPHLALGLWLGWIADILRAAPF